MNRRTFFPLLWPAVLLLIGWTADFLYLQQTDLLRLEARLTQRQHQLGTLRARAVAFRIESTEYRNLVAEFQSTTGLFATDPFRDPGTVRGTRHVAIFIGAVETALRNRSSIGETYGRLHFLGVTPGPMERFSPFVSVEFALNLSGRFSDIPGFLDLLSEIGRRQKFSISVGALSVRSLPSTGVTGQLSISLPVRAYFRE